MGLSADDTDLYSIDFSEQKIYKHSGITRKLQWSYVTNVPYSAITLINGSLIGASYITDKIYVHNGETSEIVTTFNTPGPGCIALTHYGNNLVSADIHTNKIYIHNGIHAFDPVHDTSFTLSFTGVSGAVIRNSTLYTCSNITNLIYKHVGISSAIAFSFSTPSSDISGITLSDSIETSTTTTSSSTTSSTKSTSSSSSTTITSSSSSTSSSSTSSTSTSTTTISSSTSSSTTSSTASTTSSTSSTSSTTSSFTSSSSTSTSITSSSTTSSTSSTSSSTSSTFSTSSSTLSSSSSSSTTAYTTITEPVFDLDHITCFVELLHSIPKYKTNKVVLASTTIHGRQFWIDNATYVVFNNPLYQDNLSIRLTCTLPERTFTIEQSITNRNTVSELDITIPSTGPLPLYPEEIITRGFIDKHMKPLLDLDFTANYPVVRGLDFSYSGGGDRLLPREDTWVKQTKNTLVPGIVELADDAVNNLNIRLVPLREGIPQNWTINTQASKQIFGYITEKYSFANSWRCSIFNYTGEIELTTFATRIVDKSKGYLFGGYFTLNANNEELDSFNLSLIFRNSSTGQASVINKTIEASLLTGIEPIEVFVKADNIPSFADSVQGKITFGSFTLGNNAVFTMELPQLINNNVVTYPVYKHRYLDAMVVSNRNINTQIGVIVCEFIATHNEKNFYFDSTRNNLDGFSAYFNGSETSGALNLLINNDGTTYTLKTPWRQKWYDEVLSRITYRLPTDPDVGDRYLYVDKIAEYTASGWTYTHPVKGSAVWLADESKAYVFDGVRWISYNVSEEGKSSVAFVWNQATNTRKIYGNGILLGENNSIFVPPVKTHRILIGCKADGTLHINTKIVRFLIGGDTLVSFE